MRFILTLIVLGVCVVESHAQGNYFARPSAAAPPTYLLNQNFEGTGYDNSETWTETLNDGTIDEDYTTTVLHGSQSLFINDTVSPYPNTVSSSWSSATVTYGYFMLRLDARPGSLFTLFIGRLGANTRFVIDVLATGAIRAYGNVGGSGTAAIPVSVLSGSTTYHIWWSIDATSSPETVTIAFSTDGVRPTSGNNYASSVSDMSSNIDRLFFTTLFLTGSSTTETIIDRVLVDDVQIGDNP